MTGKETTVNVLLGLLLLGALAAPLAAVLLVLYGAGRAVEYFFPALAHPSDIVLYSLTCLAAMADGIRCLRRRLWPSAFISIAIVPAVVLLWLTNQHLGRAHDEFLSNLWPLFLLLVITTEHRLQRWEFMLGATLLGAGIASITGLLGSGALARYALSGVWLGVIAMFVVKYRRESRSEQTAPATPATHA